MLAPYWRLHFYWEADQTLTYNNGARINVRCKPWKFVSGPALEYGTVIPDDMGFGTGGTLATGNSTEGDEQNNTSNLYLGVKGFLEVIADQTSTDGTGYLYLEESDDNSNWPSDADNFDIQEDLTFVTFIKLATTAEDQSRAVNFEF